jgi:serine/threonine-protein kinase mTOR
LIHQLLADVGKEHPQALVYSLTVASKSQSVTRKNAALAILDKMRLHSNQLVVQALLVSQELIRVAILWHEMWHEGLEEASKLYFTEQNVEGMFATLEPLHQMLERVFDFLLGARDTTRSDVQSNIRKRFGRCSRLVS